jgi:hypothetical protein
VPDSFIINGIKTTSIRLGDRGRFREELKQWLNLHTEGEYIITPVYVHFTFEKDATIFNVGYKEHYA